MKYQTQQRDWQWRGWKTRYVFTQNFSTPKKATPLLLLHGFGAAVGHWRGNYAGLAEHYPVYALDLLGFGNSEKPPTYYGAGVWAEQVYDFWRTFIRQPMVIVGNSIGALVALMATNRHPEMSKGVIAISLPDLTALEEMVPKPIRPLKQSLEAIVGSVLARPLFYLIRRPQSIKFVLENFAYGDRTHVDDQLVQIIAQPAQDPLAVQAFYYLNLSINQANDLPSSKQAIAALQVPILMLWGAKDRIIPPTLGRNLVKYSSRAQLVEFPSLGHCPQDEAPELVNQEILTWMQEKIS
ncbi:putative hydrolase or acyltransferase of alpha/beta superfamily [Synechococcus sp. PCC 7502]|uniref:alpha/beta fold hydrolase n=1 Tax=Synechococcus sp. PCC 7502 TaxID=1173263 RepID=UPI00029FD3C1|nr:alpha/beta fold hydrolase [Synechococcus sp. PCC 7502]AFY74148.1 putative hydrolase or acyltransferase of alpha/beta superfamily [Synechococcus sp. PCC 7502]